MTIQKRRDQIRKRKNVCSVNNKKLLHRTIDTRKAKTHKGRKILDSRTNLCINEGPKMCLFARGTRCNPTIRSLMGDLCLIRKPYSIMLGKKHEGIIDLFENPEPLEYLAKKNNCALFCFGSTNKTHPLRLIFGRTFNSKLLDMYETLVEQYIPLSQFAKKTQTIEGSKPIVICEGIEFEQSEELKFFRNCLLDLFCFGQSNKILVKGIDQVIVLTGVSFKGDNSNFLESSPGSRIIFRRYKISGGERRGINNTTLYLDEIGPSFSMNIKRFRLPDSIVWQLSIPKQVKALSNIKNISTTFFGETLGQIHVGTQDLTAHHHVHRKKKKKEIEEKKTEE